MGDHKCPYCMKKVTNLFSAIKCHLCKNYYHDSCSKRVKTRSDGAFIKCCGDDDILDISDGVSSDVVNGQGDLDFHDASSAIENKLEGTTVTHDDFKQFYINFEKFMNDKLNKHNAIYNKLDNKIDSSNKMLIEQVNKHVSDEIDSIKTVIAKIEQKIEYNEKIVENAVERIDSIEADVRELINKECNDEIVLNKIKKRMQRERNIIFFNIKENASEEEDTKTINNLLSNTHIDLSGLQVLRLGKHNPSIIRPLRVRFNSLDDLPNDMENYMQYHVLGSVLQVHMKPGCIPSRFECQSDRRKQTSNTTERSYVLKKKRRILIEDSVKNLAEKSASTQLEAAASSSESSALDTIEEDRKEPTTSPKWADKSVQVHIIHKFRSKAVQTDIKLVSRFTSPIKPDCCSISISPLKIASCGTTKSKISSPFKNQREYLQKTINRTVIFHIHHL
ncbi:hypothetical protein FQA39_LY01467 [Lamprigera yunnana]|nr:hypothetical protein FQA39_LY01467 [Lamprigera yunnana]